MKLRNISNRPVVLRDTSGTLYEVPSYSQIDVNSALWADDMFRRTMRYRIRDIVVSDDVATALPTVINAPNAAATPLILAGTTSQTGDLLQLKNVGGTVLAKFNSTGVLTSPSISLAAGSAGVEPITIQAVSGQTANLQSWRDQANVQLVAITASGQLKLGSDVTLIRGAANTLEIGQKILANQGAGGPVAIAVKASADANEKFSVLSTNGSVNFGSGTGATDTVLQRAAANVLETTGDWRVGNGIIVSQGTVSPTTAALGIRFGSGLDTNIYRSAADTLKTDDSFIVGVNLSVTGTTTFTGIPSGPTAAGGTNTTQLATTAFVQNAVAAISGGSGGIAFLGNAQVFTAVNTFEGASTAVTPILTRVTSDGTPRHAVYTDGKHEWGPGNAARDVNLYRAQADRLKTDDEFEVGAQLRLTATGIRFNDGTTQTTAPVTLAHAASHHPQTGSDRIVMSLSSAIASRPAGTAVVDGTLHISTDEGIVYRSNGTAWSKVAVRDYTQLDNKPASDAAAATASLRTLGTGSTQAAAGNDTRFTDARTPTAHASSHAPGGSDPINIGGKVYIATSISGLNTAWGGTPPAGATGVLRLGTTPFSFLNMIYDTSLGKWVSDTWRVVYEPMQHNTTVDYRSTARQIIAHDYNEHIAAGLDLQLRAQWMWLNDSASEGYVGLVVYANNDDGIDSGGVELFEEWRTISNSGWTMSGDGAPNSWRTIGATWDAYDVLQGIFRVRSNASPGNTTTYVQGSTLICRYVSV